MKLKTVTKKDKKNTTVKQTVTKKAKTGTKKDKKVQKVKTVTKPKVKKDEMAELVKKDEMAEAMSTPRKPSKQMAAAEAKSTPQKTARPKRTLDFGMRTLLAAYKKRLKMSCSSGPAAKKRMKALLSMIDRLEAALGPADCYKCEGCQEEWLKRPYLHHCPTCGGTCLEMWDE